jgi:hypothetical protein
VARDVLDLVAGHALVKVRGASVRVHDRLGVGTHPVEEGGEREPAGVGEVLAVLQVPSHLANARGKSGGVERGAAEAAPSDRWGHPGLDLLEKGRLIPTEPLLHLIGELDRGA